MRMSEENFLKKAKLAVDGVFEYKINSKCDGIEDEGMKCRAGKSSFWINWQGKMTPCVFLDNVAIDVFENGFSKSWNYIVQESNKIFLSSDCASCDKREVCQVCPAASYSETGSFEKKPEYLCTLTDEMIRILT